MCAARCVAAVHKYAYGGGLTPVLVKNEDIFSRTLETVLSVTDSNILIDLRGVIASPAYLEPFAQLLASCQDSADC